MRTFLLLILVASLIPAAIQAQKEIQETDQAPSYTITVTADRLEEPLTEKSDAVTIITRDQIEAQQWHYVLDALRQVPGVILVQNGSPGKTTSVFLRGAGSSQVLVLLDGIPINNPYVGGVNFEDLTTDNVERIEVLKGPQSPLYGSDSIAGVIQIITRKGGEKNSIGAAFEGGSFNTYREKASLHGNSRQLNYSLSLARYDSEGQFDNDEFSENVFSARGGYRFNDKTYLSLTGHVFDSETGIPFHFLPSLPPSPLQNQQSNLSLLEIGTKHNAGKFINLDTRFSYTTRDYFFEDPGLYGSSQSSSDGYQFTVQNDFYLNNNTLSAGYEYEHETIDAKDDFNGSYPLTDINDHALFLQNKLGASPWILTAGFRYDHYNTFGDTMNPRISAAYRFANEWKVRGSFGTGFRAPSASDLGYPFYGNPDLKPEKSSSWEIGVDKSWSQGGRFSASWFRNDYDDLITADPITFIAVNIAKAKSQGLEVEAAWPYRGWTLNGSYTFLDTEDEITRLRLPRRPEHSGSIRIGYQAHRWGSSLNIQSLSDRFERDFLASVNVLNPGYYKVDLAGCYQLIPSLRLKGRVENLTNKQYEEALYYKALGRGFYGGIELTFE